MQYVTRLDEVRDPPATIYSDDNLLDARICISPRSWPVLSIAPEALEAKIKENSLPPEAAEVATVRLSMLRTAAPDSFEHVDGRHYLNELLAVPWAEPPAAAVDLDGLRKAVDLGAYAPQSLNETMVEFLAELYSRGAAALPADRPTPVLIGPPGIGKRTLARKIGEAIGRPVEIIDLRLTENDSDVFGASTDRVRGRPGWIVRALQRAGRRDAVIVFAGVEWAVRSWPDHGLRLLRFVFDPAERRHFRDRFLDVDMDLSQALIILTTSSLQFLPPEVENEIVALEWAGFTRRRKIELAKSTLIPDLQERHGLTDEDFFTSDESLGVLIDEYTDEAGVADLQRQLGELCRKVAASAAAGKPTPQPIEPEGIRKLLGPPRSYGAEGQVFVRPGMTKGLVETSAGASLQVVEVAVVPGTEGFGSAGQVSDALARIVDVAYHYVRSRMTEMDISARQLYEYAYRVNVRGQADEAESPMLGLAVAVAFVSQIRDRPVDPELALVGEITLNGKVLGAPGLQHKMLAAHRNGIRRVVLPKENLHDLEELPDELKAEIAVIAVDDVEQAIRVAL